jgi:hypothetical protein
MRRQWIWVLPIVCVLWACASNGSTRSVGVRTKPESRVAVQSGGPYQARWQTLDIAIDFEYQREVDRFDITGNVELQKRIQHFTTLDHLRIRVHFLGAEGVILATYLLWSAGHHGNMHYHFVNFNFNKQYPPPAGTEMIAFSYTGEASDAGGDGLARRSGGRGDWSFWWTP